jgi:hypothetical protein
VKRGCFAIWRLDFEKWRKREIENKQEEHFEIKRPERL